MRRKLAFPAGLVEATERTGAKMSQDEKDNIAGLAQLCGVEEPKS